MTVQRDDLHYYFKENRFPPWFTPRTGRGLPNISAPKDPLFQKMIGYFFPSIQEAIQASSSPAAKASWLASLALLTLLFVRVLVVALAPLPY